MRPPSSNNRDIPIVGGWSTQNKHSDHRALETALAALRDDTALMPNAPAIQIVVQFCGQRDYPRWASAWRDTWGDAGVQTPTLVWPRGLPTGQVAALLLPLPAGRVRAASDSHPPPSFEPVLVHALLPADVGARDFGLNLILRWIASRTGGEGARLAPPILELTEAGRVNRRSVETYGTTWDLPSVDAQ